MYTVMIAIYHRLKLIRIISSISLNLTSKQLECRLFVRFFWKERLDVHLRPERDIFDETSFFPTQLVVSIAWIMHDKPFTVSLIGIYMKIFAVVSLHVNKKKDLIKSFFFDMKSIS